MREIVTHNKKQGLFDWSTLYLRVIIGIMILLHNISKLQSYNDIISEYNSAWGISSALWFLLIASTEVISALLLIIGLYVRYAAVALIVGTMVILSIYFNRVSTIYIELQTLYTFIYIYILAVGSGAYSMDALLHSRTRAKA